VDCNGDSWLEGASRDRSCIMQHSRQDPYIGSTRAQVDMVSPTEGDPCCAPQHAQSPLEKDFEGIRDVNVSVSLMEDFMRCVRYMTPAW